jgi:acyl-coenzyme A synthetase/AMP-(fatty) acid ligase
VEAADRRWAVIHGGIRREDRWIQAQRRDAAARARCETDRRMGNFAVQFVERAPPDRLAIVEIARDGHRREWSFGQIAAAARTLAAHLHAAHGVRRGDVVLTLVGNQPEWVATMVACFRQGYVALPCNEQLRARDLALRLAVCRPAAVVCDVRNEDVLTASGWDGPTVWVPGLQQLPADADPPAAAHLSALDPCLITFTSGTAGAPKAALHGQRYLAGQRVQAEHWLAPQPGDLVWCTAASGWSKSARNAFIAPWIRGAAALLHDARFDPAQRLELLERERVNVLCMAPTEYRVIAKRATLRPIAALRGLVAAGEALNPGVLHAWEEATGLQIRDGYGQTETGQLTGMAPGSAVRPGSMGLPLPGIGLTIDDGELVVDPATVPTFFLNYLGDEPAGEPVGETWRTGDRVAQDEDGFLFFEGRTDDVIISAGYRIGPFEVESALVAHEAVAEAAVVAAPDDERGSVVRAVVVLRDGYDPSGALARALQDHVKEQTAPYKYPRRVDFAAELPRTASGKIRRAQLREQG